MSDDFFASLDADMARQRAALRRREARLDEIEAWVRGIIPDLATVAETYRRALKPRGIQAQVVTEPLAITFALAYANGDVCQLKLMFDRSRGGLVDQGYFLTSGQPTVTTSGWVRKGPRWTTGKYEMQLERHIKAYVAQADRHGGVR